MQEFDQFGRPIYETAEEYNRANKAGRSFQINEMQKGNQFSRKDSMNLKKMFMGWAVFCFAILIVIVFFMISQVADVYQEVEVHWDEIETDVYEGYLGDGETPLPEGFETFYYNGQMYTLPTSYHEISQMGFVLETEYEDSLFQNEYEELFTLNDPSGYFSALIRVNNYSGEAIPIGECFVDYFYIENLTVYEGTEHIPEFVFGDGLTFKSTYEDLVAYFGNPYYHNRDILDDGDVYDSYEWIYYRDNEIHYVSIAFFNNMISDVGIEKKQVETK